LQAYVRAGGHLVTTAQALQQEASPFAIFSPRTTAVELVPTVDAARRTADLTLAGIRTGETWSGDLTVAPTGLGLPDGTYHLVNLATGQDIPAASGTAGLTVPLQVPPATLQVWALEPGAGPTVTLPSATGAAGGAASFVAGRQGGQVIPLNITPAGGAPSGDGNVTQVQQAGKAALATWTLQQLHTAGAYLYLQVDPAAALYRASSMELTVTYLATPGQGFQVQYDGTAGPYEQGPTVRGDGSGRWVTATVRLPGTALAEAENGGADLRLFVLNGGAPLYVHAIEIRAAGQGGP